MDTIILTLTRFDTVYFTFKMEPTLYTLVACPVIGVLGGQTHAIEFSVCEVCELRQRTAFQFIDYCFDKWSGQDLVSILNQYFISQRLRFVIAAASLQGITFQDMTVSKGNYFKIESLAYANVIPPFFHLALTKVAGPESWWLSNRCEACGITNWNISDVGLVGQMAGVTGEIAQPREVYRDSWAGEDMFYLQDPGPPLITQRFANVLSQLGVMGIVLQPAKWADRPQ